ncbi:signal peptidase I [Thermococcus sp.]
MKGLIKNITITLLLMFLTASVAGFLLDRPILISYAYSESMTPTINKGDLFFINPLSRTGDVGDIIVFHRRDGWTVHRIFAVSENGYLTKGDNNVATDQQDGIYPPVKPSDVAGKVITLSGHPLVIRGGGAFIESMRKRLTSVYAVVIFLILGAFLTFSGGGKKRSHSKRRKFIRVRARTLYAVLSVGIIAGFIFVTVASWGTLAFTYSSTLAGGQKEGWYLPGSSFERNLTVKNSAVYPFYYFVGEKGEGAEITNARAFKLGGGSFHNVTVDVKVPADTRIYRVEVAVRSYPAILPGNLVAALYGANPYLPLVAYSAELALVLLAFYRLADIADGDVLRIRTRRRSLLSKLMGDG